MAKQMRVHILAKELNVTSKVVLVKCTAEGATRLKNGNPGMVFAADAEYGDECWASFEGKAVAVGIYKAGELHPSRVFNT